MRLISRLGGAVAGLLFLASLTHASVIVVSYTSSYSQPNVTNGLDIPLSFQQFDPSLGTLESVGLEDSFLLTATAFQAGLWLFDNCVPDTETTYPNPNTATFTGITGASKSVQADAADVATLLDAVSCSSGTTGTASASYDVTSLLTGGAMSGYIGLSQIGLNTHLDGGDGGGSVSGTSTVTFTYDTATPEPGTFFMAGVGFAILAWARGRRVRIRRTS